jgi:hypothetical protein
VSVLKADIAAFDRMKAELERSRPGVWVLFYKGSFIGDFPDFEAAAATAVERFEAGPYLIRQVGAKPIQLPGGMVFTPAHVLGASRI